MYLLNKVSTVVFLMEGLLETLPSDAKKQVTYSLVHTNMHRHALLLCPGTF